MPFYPASVETRITNRNEAEKIAPILARVIEQIHEKEKELHEIQAHANDLDKQAEAARAAGEHQKAFRLTQDAIEVRKQAKAIKDEIKKLDEKHASLLNRARSGSGIEYR